MLETQPLKVKPLGAKRLESRPLRARPLEVQPLEARPLRARTLEAQPLRPHIGPRGAWPLEGQLLRAWPNRGTGIYILS